ncbi:MAG: hypothetical protein IJR41_04850 [Atopobiaceae bacterium]|nr:hypothetical protein [Atopobiaceae bacterium]
MEAGTREGAFFTPSGGKGAFMSEDTAQQEKTAEFQAITSQEQLDKIIQNRLTRERAKHADYDELKSKAARLDELEQANKTELEKANERANELQKQVDAYHAREQREQWARAASQETGVDASLIRGDSAEEMLAHAQAIKSLRPAYPAINDSGKPKPSLTKDEILAIKNTAERRRAIAENAELFR